MGPVSATLIVVAAGLVLATLGSRDRAVAPLSWYVALDLLLSLFAHWAFPGWRRSTPLMLLDGVGLYLMGLTAVCRFDRPLWLYGLCLATASECLSHLAYVTRWIDSDGHTLSLNLLFGVQVACLLAGRWSAPEDDLAVPAMEEFAAPA